MPPVAPDAFYTRVLSDLLRAGTINQADSILVLCGGETDFATLRHLGFTNVTISNLDERQAQDQGRAFAPYAWRYLDAQQIDLPDASHDLAIVHSGLHHLTCPPKGITEMVRVARRGILGFEPHLSAFTRLGVRLGVGQEYETAAVHANDCRWGGLENSEIPNFVYRLAPADIYRAVQTCAPYCRYAYRYWYVTRMPGRLRSLRNPLLRGLALTTGGLWEFLGRHLPPLANNFAFHVDKSAADSNLFPWLRRDEGRIRLVPDALDRIYRPPSTDLTAATRFSRVTGLLT